MVRSSPAKTESYHTQHAPFGAFASFTIGLVDAKGGFGQSLRGPAQQHVYAGFRRTGVSNWRLLPFLETPVSGEVAFTGDDTVAQAPKGYQALVPGDY